MQTQNLNKTLINDTMLNIYVKPSLDWHLEDDNFDVNSTLNLTWSVLEFKDDFLDLVLDFSHPLKISPNLVRDSLVVHFYNHSELFLSKNFQTLSPESRFITGELPKQVDSEMEGTRILS